MSTATPRKKKQSIISFAIRGYVPYDRSKLGSAGEAEKKVQEIINAVKTEGVVVESVAHIHMSREADEPKTA